MQRSLTPGEISISQSYFGNSIDYSNVTVTQSSFFPGMNVPHAPRGHIYLPGDYYVTDYAALDPLHQSIFVHEMTLVYQWKVLGVDPIDL